MRLKNKVALITGAGKGIGRQIAIDMAKEGARVVVVDISKEWGETTCREIKISGGEGIFVEGDVCSLDSLKQVNRVVTKKYGELNVLVINAGITFKRKFHEITLEEWQRTIDINLTGSFITAKAFIPTMVKGARGSILFITSSSAFTGSGGGAHYAASKSGQHGLMKNLSRELGPKGIWVNAIAPRVIETDILDRLYPKGSERDAVIEQIPMRRLGQPEDISSLACFLASDEASYINGQIILLDGGRTLL